jgi:hypothetical protein
MASPLICFLPGETPVKLTVRAETGDVARHLITVYRTLSPINTLLQFGLTGGSLQGAFAPEATSYTIIMQADSRGALERLQPADSSADDFFAQVRNKKL